MHVHKLIAKLILLYPLSSSALFRNNKCSITSLSLSLHFYSSLLNRVQKHSPIFYVFDSPHFSPLWSSSTLSISSFPLVLLNKGLGQRGSGPLVTSANCPDGPASLLPSIPVALWVSVAGRALAAATTFTAQLHGVIYPLFLPPQGVRLGEGQAHSRD